MPPQRSELVQQRISYTPTTSNPLNPRGTPRRNRNTIQNYARPERIDEVIENPPIATPCHLHPPRPTVEDAEDEDIDMEDRDEDEEEQEVEEELAIDQSSTLTRRNLPSTVVIKTRRCSTKPRKPRKETTWTQNYFDVTPLTDTWVNEALKNKPTLFNRLWTCKIYRPAFLSTNKERYSNTLKLNTYIKDEYNIDEKKHLLGILPKQKKGQGQVGFIDLFV